MNCPDFIAKCPGNPDKPTRTDTRARIRNPDIVRVRFLSALPCPVSGSRPLAQPVEIKLPGGRVQFGVTQACRVPRGVTIADVLACDLQGLAETP